ncbi:putative aspartate aminotransferase [Francisella sp. W12-1067]|nr:putative aspartate aminotransferase [Francisella sp. W12-1067]
MKINQEYKNDFYTKLLNINESVTHGTHKKINELNKNLSKEDRVIDLSIGTLDVPCDKEIDNGVIEYIKNQSSLIHQFAPVKGFDFLLKSISDRTNRLHNINYDPNTEIMVTPGGIKGSISVIFKTLLNESDEVIIPLPNWPHYSDMVEISGAKKIFIEQDNESLRKGITVDILLEKITDSTKIIILGDCINPTGKVYTTDELTNIANLICNINSERINNGLNNIYILFDCPYEAHILNNRSKHIALKNDGTKHDFIINVTGPGKTYGMHGDRIGYILANSTFIKMASISQVNMNSFASTYGQISTFFAMQEKFDDILRDRATKARSNLSIVVDELQAMNLIVDMPQGGYFIFVSFKKYASKYKSIGYMRASEFLLDKARVASISGEHFATGYSNSSIYGDYVRINCGRNIDVLKEALTRIKEALQNLE